jgi:DNA-binding transcriptional LysR family regulator
MKTFQFEQLRTFAAVVDEGTFEAAARSLLVTPSAVSQRLKAMEDAAGQILLQRTNPVRPTPAGEAVLRFARQVRQLEWDALRELGVGADGPDLTAGSRAPVMDFDRKDDLQGGFFRELTGAELTAPRHYVPSSAEFAQAIRLGLGWGLLPEQQCLADIRSGALVGLAPADPVDVSLFWQRWKIDSPLLNQLSAAVRQTASRHLRQPGA